jgi:hypothetical protein
MLRVTCFWQDYIADMTPEEFERHKEALAAQRLEKPKKLSVLSARFWSEITAQQYNFDRANIEVAHLNTLQKKDVMDFFKVMNCLLFLGYLSKRGYDRLDIEKMRKHTECCWGWRLRNRWAVYMKIEKGFSNMNYVDFAKDWVMW